MSLKSWKAEFYPIPANKVPAKDAVAHSLTKWIGLRKGNLEKHGVRLNDMEVRGRGVGVLEINARSCALCAEYLRDMVNGTCRRCPLYQVRERRCDREMEGETIAPYNAIERGDASPEPMIRWLRKAAAWEKKNGGAK